MDTTWPLGRLSAGRLKSMVRQVDSVTSYCSTRPLLSQLGGPHPQGLLSGPLDKLSWEPFPLKPSPVDTALSHRSFIPCYTRKIPCTCRIPHPALCSSTPRKDAQGLGLTPSPPLLFFTTVIHGLLVTHLTVTVIVVSLLLLFIIFIMAITKLFSFPAFFEFLHSVLTVTLLNGYYYDPHLGV